MNGCKIGTLVLMAFIVLYSPAMAQDKPWIDMENCDFCECLTEDSHLMDHMSWEHHDITNGLLSLTIVDPEYRNSYTKAQKKMEQIAMDLSSGKTGLKMCQHCLTFGKLMMLGAKLESVHTGAGDIILITSDNKEVLKSIQKYGQRCREELAKEESK